MAVVTKYVATVSWKDGADRACSTSFHVTETAANAWLSAADPTARAATALGVLFAATNQMSDATLVRYSVSLQDEQDTVVLPAVTVLRGNKLGFGYQANGRNFVFTIPARDPDDFVQGAQSIKVSLTTPAAMASFVAAYNAVGTSPDGFLALISKGYVVD